MGHFVDRCKIWVQAGNGGDGCTSFRREKYIPKGGPDGGDGGRGGDVIISALEGLYTVWMHCLSPHKVAERGKAGSGKNCSGAHGKDLIIYVPVGTQVLSEDQSTVLVDLMESEQTFLLAKGGAGGVGNTRFKSSTNRAPRRHTLGKEGQKFWAWLQVKLMVDVGLIGLPNAGKSSILRILTKATPKVADYPFTTTDPHVGVLKNCMEKILIVDVPGLIEGASEGKGLGKYFLRHVERCNLLLQIIDASNADVQNDYLIVRQELAKYQAELDKRVHVIVLNKIDLVSTKEKDIKVKQLEKISCRQVIAVSALNDENLLPLRTLIIKNLCRDDNLSQKVEALASNTGNDEDAESKDTWVPWHGK